MPYITTEQVKEKRQALKKEFPDFKFSVTKRDGMEIRVAIMEAPFQMTDKDYESVNQYWIDDHYEDRPKTKDVLNTIHEIIDSGNYTLVNDSDYGAVPKFYTSISIGKWDKPFKVKA